MKKTILILCLFIVLSVAGCNKGNTAISTNNKAQIQPQEFGRIISATINGDITEIITIGSIITIKGKYEMGNTPIISIYPTSSFPVRILDIQDEVLFIYGYDLIDISYRIYYITDESLEI